MAKYLDETGLAHFWDNIKSAIDGSGKGVLVLGDSYGEGYTPDGNVTSWIELFTNKVQQYGYTVYSTYMGGSGFYSSDNTKKFSVVIGNYISTLTTAQKESIGTVIIGGGYNDRGVSRDNIYNGMVDVRNIITANLPNVNRVLVFPFGMGVQGLTTGAHASFTYQGIVDMINNYLDANAAARLGTIVARANMLLRRNNYFSSDYVHPNENGQYVIAMFVADAFFGNARAGIAEKFNHATSPNKINNEGVTGTLNFLITQSDNGFIVYLGNSAMTFSSPTDVTLNMLNPINIATFKDAAIQQFGNFRIPVVALVKSDNATPGIFTTVVGTLEVNNGVARFNTQAANAAGNNYLTIGQLSQITMYSTDRVFVDGLYLE